MVLKGSNISFCRSLKTDLLKVTAKFVWSTKCQEAFDNVQNNQASIHLSAQYQMQEYRFTVGIRKENSQVNQVVQLVHDSPVR